MLLSKKFFRGLYWTALALYALAALGFLGLRYWALPHIERWQPDIEAYASQALGTRVSIGKISADWQGLHPRIELKDVHVYAAAGQDAPILTLPSLSAVLAWRSVLRLAPTFAYLQVDQPELRLRRDAENRLWLVGQSVDLNASGETEETAGWRWLKKQHELRIHDATLYWQDDLRQAPTLTLQAVELLIRNDGVSHRFAVRAAADAALAQQIEIRGEFQRELPTRDSQASTISNGKIYLQVDDVAPSAFAAWVDLPPIAGRLSGKAWLPWVQGQFAELSADLSVQNLAWSMKTGQAALRSDQALLHVQGFPGDFLPEKTAYWARSTGPAQLILQGQAQALQLDLPGVFAAPTLSIDRLNVAATVQRQDGWQVDVRELNLHNADLDLRVQGQWRDVGKTAAGSLALTGTLVRGAMPAIHRYLPLTVNADAREWLATGLPAGEVRAATIRLRGDLDDFPFDAEGAQGEFVMAGQYANAKVDYAPPRPQRKGWPRLENVSGEFLIDKVSLTLSALAGATMRTGPDQQLVLGPLDAVIPDMDRAAQLHLEGSVAGPVPAYLALAAHSPLGGMLDGVLEQAAGSGEWRIPLKLTVPLLNPDDSQVDGRIQFTQNRFTFMPSMPFISQMQGELAFTEKGVEARAIQGQFLGGPIKLSGRLDGAREVMRMQGNFSSAGLTQLSATPVFERFAGTSAYQATLSYQRGGAVDIAMTSALTGMAIDMPAPLGKTAASAQPFTLQWARAPGAGQQDKRWLSVKIGTAVEAVFERDPASSATAPYFSRAAVSVDRALSLPRSSTLSLNVRLPMLDLDAWERVGDTLRSPAQTKPADRQASLASVLPPLGQVSLATPVLRARGYSVNDVTLDALRSDPGVWRATVNSKQASGTVMWQPASAASAGKITAQLTQVRMDEWQPVSDEKPAMPATATPQSEPWDMPDLDVRIAQLVLYGKPLGALTVQGVNVERGHRWQLNQWALNGSTGSLQATGLWELTGPERGLTVEAEAKFENLGKFLDHLGFEQILSEGKGTIRGQLRWRDLPWRYQFADIEGQAQVSLDKGRFLRVNSGSARLLELLSLQSLRRLVTFDINPANAFRDGFAFTTIRGTVTLAGGILSTKNYKVIGSVADIALTGEVDLRQERLNLRADVTPKLDASGAAVLTGLTLNPLIGLGAFVTQWVLQRPLGHAMAMTYTVTGNWDSPNIDEVIPARASSNPPANRATQRQPSGLDRMQP